ncbi:type II toxin-antitoxin system RelE/ParE family toxin [Rothia sp. 88186D007BW]
MGLTADYSSAFHRDVKRLKKKHTDMAPLREVISLVLENTAEAQQVLRQRHRIHSLKGEWLGSQECHIANAGDWLLIWYEDNKTAYFQRTGTHDQLVRK